ncbi:putative hydroxymethylglutaryl-CoA reductase (NADPH) [Helianthus annuus]|uniref:Hydroxymethylglutaryl-CoA reductase (NADPH) n=1 Tax=Helianthus annuus TaxID=4232 RepID=A0A9K3I261_HELAN|nr:putative hydroxymethylglutaryl-CoA reductase (NADPH) [Helianthus annuus]KAJ0524192.1 putative hydroxymethylglutaryl-CoA reductase (NADPH) [Helianthus annuus]
MLPQGILHSEPSELRWVSKGVQNVFDFLQNDFQDMDLIGWGSFKIDDLSNTLSNKKHIDKRKWDMQRYLKMCDLPAFSYFCLVRLSLCNLHTSLPLIKYLAFLNA